MKLVFTKTLTNNNYGIELSVTEVAEEDTALFNDFGEPSIDIGGEIKDAAGTNVLATLPSNYRKVLSQMPVTIRFADAQYNGNAKTVAEAWIRAIEARTNTVMTAIRMKSDDFSGPEEFII
jgi:hypothetical protein